MRYEDELPGQDNVIQLNVERKQGDNSRVVVMWMASGNHNGIFDINPLDGTVRARSHQASIVNRHLLALDS